ncbi:uncharacterized protein TRAVEDRAFT_54622, partial [Trametes versicolor FP-101664 SS1]
MSSMPNFIIFYTLPRMHGGGSRWTRECLEDDLRGYFNGGVCSASNGRQKRMRYAPRSYASDIVNKCGIKIAGWPQNIPFTDVSNIDGGSAPLAELHRMWNLPAGDPDRLRFEPASHEDR